MAEIDTAEVTLNKDGAISMEEGQDDGEEEEKEVATDQGKKQNEKNEDLKKKISPGLVGLAALTAFITNEFRLQRKLTRVPQVFYQGTMFNYKMVSFLSKYLMREMRPSLIFGTHPVLNSSSGYAKVGPKSKYRVREVLTMSADGAKVALDWEFPGDIVKECKEKALLVRGPHKVPVVLILHGINNDAGFGYIRCMMETCTKMGWIAVGMNMRGCGHGIQLATPRGYNGKLLLFELS